MSGYSIRLFSHSLLFFRIIPYKWIASLQSLLKGETKPPMIYNPFFYDNLVDLANFLDRRQSLRRVVGRLLNGGQVTTGNFGLTGNVYLP